jgi:hypothetical protein
MRRDERGAWQRMTIDGHTVEWRRRKSVAQDAHFGTNSVVDISVDGKPPVTQEDFVDAIDHEPQLELRVRLLIR